MVEQVAVRIFDLERLAVPYKSDLAARLGDNGFRAAVGPEIAAKADAIRKVGNVAVHESRSITPQTALNVLRQLHDVLKWTAFTYSTSPDEVPTGAAYDPSLIPAPSDGGGQPPLSTAELNRLLTTFEEKDAALAALKADSVALQDHEDDVALQKLRRNKQLTDTDLAALEAMLVASGAGGPEDIARAAEEAQGLGLFIRSLVGMDREAAAEAFSEFLTNSRFTAAEIRFIDLIVEHLTANGVMEARRLYEAPFTDDAPTGPDFLFADADTDRLITVLDEIRAHASAS